MPDLRNSTPAPVLPINADEAILVRGVRVNNLKNIDVDIPHNQLVVLSGVSGSGKSSLAFDTLFAEGQRRYLESLSTYTRQFLDQLERPDVDTISGLPPTISIDQKTGSVRPRSTLATTTQIYDYLRLLYARAGQAHCPQCGVAVSRQTSQQIVDRILELEERRKVMILAPMVRGRKGQHRGVFEKISREGFVRARVNSEVIDAADPPELSRGKTHHIEAVVDRIIIKEGIRPRLQESVDLALSHGQGACLVSFRDGETWHDRLYSERFVCVECGESFAELEPRTFSFNSPYGACPECEGLGKVQADDADGKTSGDIDEQQVCKECNGSRLNPFARSVTFGGVRLHELTALSVAEASVVIGRIQKELHANAEYGSLTPEGRLAAERTLPEIASRLGFLEKVGLEYLSLDRTTQTLSGGEFQRARLAAGLGSGLTGVCYILDEPTVGLHARDSERLILVLEELREQGSSLIVVEHDEELMRRADYLIDIGPGAGTDGGEVVAAGTPDEVAAQADSATARFLRDGSPVATEDRRAIDHEHALSIYGARLHNLRDVDVEIPLGALVCVTGVSGSGKSSLFTQTLVPALKLAVAGKPISGPFERLEGVENFTRIVEIDQKPIGRSGRSNAATYTGLWNEIRKLYARTRDARLRGYKARRFSFNAREGRCDHCKGTGADRIEMQFLPDLFVTCPVCKGDRFNRQTLSIRFAGMNLADVLRLKVSDALQRFENVPKLHSLLQTLDDVGLGYLELGQSSLTLSGGEAQRIKLAGELTLTAHTPTLVLLDEPTTGLHPVETARLIATLQRLVEQGSSVVVIEHQLDVIAAADWVIDMGPEGGAGGGQLVAAGTPEEIAAITEGHTGTALRRHLARDDKIPPTKTTSPTS
ncbi:MAG: ABC-ATPase UvrA [Planctomycetaceae bacterium]|jgi:excinuclease ABC subunit A|nr:ABC-ATPase UvrA [Planctomycetaceae bacterium]MBT6486854.1 ABC-ATPase UvrA [Planctomycetaceae bacterium]MBT6496062.1 ABC-ATPase UvrA [Planctomycetaceae bacterium]